MGNGIETSTNRCDVGALTDQDACRGDQVPPAAHLLQMVPVCDGLAMVGQHLVPVVPPKTLSIQPRSAHTNNLVVADPVSRWRER